MNENEYEWHLSSIIFGHLSERVSFSLPLSLSLSISIADTLTLSLSHSKSKLGVSSPFFSSPLLSSPLPAMLCWPPARSPIDHHSSSQQCNINTLIQITAVHLFILAAAAGSLCLCLCLCYIKLINK